MWNNRTFWLIFSLISLQFAWSQNSIWDVHRNLKFELTTTAQKIETQVPFLENSLHFQYDFFDASHPQWAKHNSVLIEQGKAYFSQESALNHLRNLGETRLLHFKKYLAENYNETSPSQLRFSIADLFARVVAISGSKAVIEYRFEAELLTGNSRTSERVDINLYYLLEQSTGKLSRLESHFTPEQQHALTEWIRPFLAVKTTTEASPYANPTKTDKTLEIDWNHVNLYYDFGGIVVDFPAFTSGSKAFNYQASNLYIPLNQASKLVLAYAQLRFLHSLAPLTAKRNFTLNEWLEKVNRLQTEPEISYWIKQSPRPLHSLKIRTEQVFDSTRTNLINQQEFIFNAKNRLAQMRTFNDQALVNSTLYFYDESGKLLSETSSTAQKKWESERQYTYDSFGNLVSKKHLEDDGVTTTYYQYNGNFVYQLQQSASAEISFRISHSSRAYQAVYELTSDYFRQSTTKYSINEQNEIWAISTPETSYYHAQFFEAQTRGITYWQYHADHERHKVIQQLNAAKQPVEITSYDGYTLKRKWIAHMDETGKLPQQIDVYSWNYSDLTQLRYYFQWDFTP